MLGYSTSWPPSLLSLLLLFSISPISLFSLFLFRLQFSFYKSCVLASPDPGASLPPLLRPYIAPFPLPPFLFALPLLCTFTLCVCPFLFRLGPSPFLFAPSPLFSLSSSSLPLSLLSLPLPLPLYLSPFIFISSTSSLPFPLHLYPLHFLFISSPSSFPRPKLSLTPSLSFSSYPSSPFLRSHALQWWLCLRINRRSIWQSVYVIICEYCNGWNLLLKFITEIVINRIFFLLRIYWELGNGYS